MSPPPPNRFSPRLIPGNGRVPTDDVDDLAEVLGTVVRTVDRLEVRQELLIEDVRKVRSTQGEHTEILGRLMTSVSSIERRLNETEQTAKDAQREASRVSATSEVVQDFVEIAAENQRVDLEAKKAKLADETQGRKEWRQSHIKTIAVIVGFVFSVAGAGAIGRCTGQAKASDDPVPSAVESAVEALPAEGSSP